MLFMNLDHPSETLDQAPLRFNDVICRMSSERYIPSLEVSLVPAERERRESNRLTAVLIAFPALFSASFAVEIAELRPVRHRLTHEFGFGGTSG